MWIRVIGMLVAFASVGHAQNGDRPGEEQPALPAHIQAPPAPPLSPEDALKSFRLQPGFRIDLVASDPMIESPVALAFDPDGRLWVLEMRGFMPNADGIGEDAPVGRVSVLEDVDGDGRMDKRTIFLDGLVMPRALALVRGGALIAEPPHLWFCRDTNGDGKCDEKIEVANDYATEADPKLGSKMNPEHSANGLMWAMDNWIYSANYTTRFRNVDGSWHREPTVSRGQWGLTQDDFGRIFHNSNSDPLRADLVPSQYLSRNPNLRGAVGVNFQVAKDLAVWPIRVNPGVNRGYQKGQLRDDGRLATYTGACGPCIYRGENFPKEFSGAAFVCEPTGNLIRCERLTESDGFILSTNAFPQAEFLASTDERFRPVNLYTGPDGGLYVVDMYRGILQHRMYLTSYLRKQSLSRALDKAVDRGRIYRIVADGRPLNRKPALSNASGATLVATLAHSNGWWRDTAQRLLIERADAKVVPDLKELVASGKEALARLHALWTLDGLGRLDARTLEGALDDTSPKVQAAAIRLAEPFLKTGDSQAATLWNKTVARAASQDADVLIQLGATLSETKGTVADQALSSLLARGATNALIREAVISGLRDRELEFLERLSTEASWMESTPARVQTFATLARCVLNTAKADKLNGLLSLAAKQPAAAWKQMALLNGLAEAVPPKVAGKPANVRLVKFEAEPTGLTELKKIERAEIRERVEQISSLFTWPGKPGSLPEVVAQPLTAEEQERFKAGKELYLISCGACHQPTGLGQEGLAPGLLDSEWVLGSEQRLIRITLQGVRGPLTVKGKVYSLEMPTLAVFNDDQLACVLTYVRREWGHTAAPVAPATIAKIRAATEKREEAWTEAELLKLP
ncbi:MAG: dehydrogenase [Verrucomicrobia bacterium]|nr:dehydrogenase [Verrucomicrobiota bacterium]